MIKLRQATSEDYDKLRTLIWLSAREVNKDYYSSAEIEAALGSVWEVDDELIADGTYWVAVDDDETIIGCGGWSKRQSMYGKKEDGVDSPELNPEIHPAKIRAFFVHPDHTRKGIGMAILKKCEEEAANSGFKIAELVATLSGEKLYSKNGFIAGDQYELDLPNGEKGKVYKMTKQLI